ncbi:MAG TPA: Calx-beta domain-containing protein, partial [Blastocatellia bacterium]|nr:Calx-beta domain-containing protein [Blastocatellia bacterium]
NDAGPGSFRNAITKSNQTTGAQTISFNLPGAGPHRIEPITAFPAVSDPLTIDATTQPGFSGTPIIELTGNNRVGVPVGLDLRSGNNTIKGLSINRFYGAAIVISSAMTGGNTIQANYIGTNTAGDTALPNGIGIVIGTPNNLIGGSTASERNLISGNQGSGIQIGLVPNAGAATGNVVVGNLIGTDAAGTAPLPNNSGIIIVSSQTTIGGLSAGQAN